MGKLTQFYPRCIAYQQTQVGDYYEEDFWDEIRPETMRQPDGVVQVIGLYDKDERAHEIRERLEQDVVDLSRVQLFTCLTFEKKVSVPPTEAHDLVLESLSSWEEIQNPPKITTPSRRWFLDKEWGEMGWRKQDVTPVPVKPAREVTHEVTRRINLGNKAGLQLLVQTVRDGASAKNFLKSLAGEPSPLRVKALLIYEPNLDEEDLKYLPDFIQQCPDVDVYIFHRPDEAKWGVERTGDVDSWQDEFPALGSLQFEMPEMIVADFIIKGSIHVFAGRFETYKTMTLIELCAAMLEGRKVFDELAVNVRYPILFLEEDMSPEQFNAYAAPFDLAKYGDAFRVKHPKSIMHAVDSPVLQKAVRGRILILDTMLDFAQIENAYESGEWVTFMQRLRELMTVHGCVAILMTAHATKTGAKSNDIDPSEYFKDSATFGGKVDIGYGFKSVDSTSQVEIKRIKGRGFTKPLNFTIAVRDDDGESNLSQGRFPVYQKPGEFKKQGRPAKREPEMLQQIKALRAEGKSNYDIGEAVGVSEKTVRRIVKEDREQTFDFNKENQL
jgi:hypothetical protein